MAEIVVFHHALGSTSGVTVFAGMLREAGHTAHTPDLFDGRTFDSLEAGVAHAEEIGLDTVMDRGEAAVAGLPADLVYAGFSLGVMPAQRLAQTRPGARGAVLVHSAVPPGLFGEWPAGVPVQIHLMEGDPWAEEDAEAARILVSEAGADLFTYPGSEHLFADASLPSYDPEAAALLAERTLEFLARAG